MDRYKAAALLASTALVALALACAAPLGAPPHPTTPAPGGPGGGQEASLPGFPTGGPPPPGPQPTDDLELPGLTPRPSRPWHGRVTYYREFQIQWQRSTKQAEFQFAEQGGRWTAESSIQTQVSACERPLTLSGSASGSGTAVLEVLGPTGALPSPAMLGTPNGERAVVTVAFLPNGTYRILLRTPPLRGSHQGFAAGNVGGQCKVIVETSEVSEPGVEGWGEGRMESATPTVLSGSYTETQGNTTTTVTWHLAQEG